ncbi:MAG: ATP-dependent DNA helicase RecG [Planctomycetota bacterium]|nr:ATP-dependent DNA helicase RecG [Planctomycetota bacterium]
MASLELDTPVQYVKGVGPRRAEQLAKAGVRTVEDLLLYFPRRFNLRRQVQPIGTLRGDEPAATVAGVVRETNYKPFGRKPYFECGLDDGTGGLVAKWFHGGYLKDRIKPEMHLAVSGKVSVYRETLQFINPRFEVIWSPEETNLQADELLPVYPACGSLPSGLIANLIKRVLPEAPRLFARWFDDEHLRRRDLPPRPGAIAAMHRPEDKAAWTLARRRLAYDEFILMQLGIALQRMRSVSRPAHPLEVSDEIDRRIRARFPFSLTAAQNRVLGEIAADLARPRPMNRLLQGDVGSGKTVVALYAALAAVAHRKQAAVMAPTEILARQHYAKVEQYLSDSRVRTALLVSAQKPAERAEILEKLAAGEIDIVVGTHALLSQKVRFRSLAVTVVDEQHKFGVRQRSGFRAKGYAPHCLVMTATPIPRTLALTVFGDLDVSVIDEMPPGRGGTVTRCVDKSRMSDVVEFVRERLAEGQQAFFVYPLVSDLSGGQAGGGNSQLTAAQTAYEEFSSRDFDDYSVGLIHGQMPTTEQQSAMKRFAAGEIRVLVASTVVEVGLDVPNANVMVVVNAERFGLAQLHQLRGRVGRGAEDAVCILVAGSKNPIAAERLRALVETSDGFKIAETDLRLRGPGEFFGTRQHGLPELKIADLIDDYELLRMARRDAFAIVRDDPDISAPEHQTLRAEMLKAYGGRVGLIAEG